MNTNEMIPSFYLFPAAMDMEKVVKEIEESIKTCGEEYDKLRGDLIQRFKKLGPLLWFDNKFLTQGVFISLVFIIPHFEIYISNSKADNYGHIVILIILVSVRPVSDVEGDKVTQMLPIADSLQELLALLQIICNSPGDIKVYISNNKYYIIYLKVEFESSRGRV